MTPEERTVRAYQTASSRLRQQVQTVVTTAWRSLGSYRDADIDRLVTMLLPRVRAGQLQMANLTASYLAKLTGERAPVDRDEILDARGTDPHIVYRRPAVEVYTALAQGKSMVEVAGLGERRLQSIATTDLQLACTHQTRSSMAASGIDLYRRQLTGDEDCALCVIASTQRYWKGDLMPIHPGCDCITVPLVAGIPQQQVIDEELLEHTHDHVARFAGTSDRGARDLGRGKTVTYSNGKDRLADYTDLIITREHGEYGPTLSWRSDNFTGPDDLHTH